MSWKSFAIRVVLMVTIVCGLLYWAEQSVPFAALLVFLLVLSIASTWAIISLMKDDDPLTGFFD
jgi:hypothetical protein